MKNRKLIFKALSLLFCLILLLTFALSFSVSAAPPHVVDRADLLTEEEEATLTAKLQGIIDTYGHDIAVVTTNSLDGKNVQHYADDYFDRNSYGIGPTDSGILLVVSMAYPREYAMTTTGDAAHIFDEGDFDDLEDAFVSKLSAGQYAEAFNAFADECVRIIKYDGRLSPAWIIIALIVGALVASLVLWSMISKHKNVKKQQGANQYMLRNTFHLDRSRDVFLYSHVTRVAKPQSNNSSGGRSGGGGRSRGGRSGRF